MVYLNFLSNAFNVQTHVARILLHLSIACEGDDEVLDPGMPIAFFISSPFSLFLLDLMVTNHFINFVCSSSVLCQKLHHPHWSSNKETSKKRNWSVHHT
jgi:hypothetical protein